MKKWLYKLTMVLAGSALLFSCKKDETRATVKEGTVPVLAASATTVTLTKATETSTAETFTITPSDFGYQAAVAYTLQFAKPGSNFANPYNLPLTGNSLNQQVTGKALNIAALNAGLDTLSVQAVQVRLKADIGSGQTPVYSAPITINVKPYSLNSYLYVPGDYQGWSPSTAPKLISINSTGIYEGYVNIILTGYMGFKMTDAPDWNHGIFGDANSSGTSGNIASPGNDIKVSSAGYYRINPNLNTNTYTVTKTSWSIIGDGAAGWSTDVPMVYDPVAQVWKATTTLSSTGQIKFRANNDWTINLGDTGANGSLEYGGDNIAVPSSGTKTVILDLHVPGAYTYSIQ